jgi:hypothetical protein
MKISEGVGIAANWLWIPHEGPFAPVLPQRADKPAVGMPGDAPCGRQYCATVNHARFQSRNTANTSEWNSRAYNTITTISVATTSATGDRNHASAANEK